jgi:hypothetical protein
MSAKIIDGRAVSKTLRKGYASRVEALKAKGGRAPGLAVILVGDSAASQSAGSTYAATRLDSAPAAGGGSLADAVRKCSSSASPSWCHRPCVRSEEKSGGDDISIVLCTVSTFFCTFLNFFLNFYVES